VKATRPHLHPGTVPLSGQVLRWPEEEIRRTAARRPPAHRATAAGDGLFEVAGLNSCRRSPFIAIRRWSTKYAEHQMSRLSALIFLELLLHGRTRVAKPTVWIATATARKGKPFVDDLFPVNHLPEANRRSKDDEIFGRRPIRCSDNRRAILATVETFASRRTCRVVGSSASSLQTASIDHFLRAVRLSSWESHLR